MKLPPLRPLDITPVEHEGETYFLLRDPEGYAEEQLLLSPPAFFVAVHLDGAHDLDAIQAAFREETGGVSLPEDAILDIVRYLDDHGFLLTLRFVERFRKLQEDFAASDVRPAYLAGRSYPADPQELRQYLDSLFLRDGGPAVAPAEAPPLSVPVRMMIAPHIDMERGGHSYAHGYLRLAQGRPPKAAFIFGVAHHTPPTPFVLTRKSFETPLGTLRNATEIVEHLQQHCSFDPLEHEIVHRTEHSIEFQAVMLAHLFGPEVRIVPILCGAFSCNGSIEPAEDVQRFLRAARQAVAETEDAVVIAAADLAHVGQCFGDAFDITDAIVRSVESRDLEDLAFVGRLDADGWYRSVMKDENERRVCGINCIYSALKCVEGAVTRSDLLHYGYAPDPTGGIVSFANVVLT